MKLTRKYIVLSYSLLIACVVFFHFELLVSDPILWRDDYSLVSAVAKTISLGDYFIKIFQGYYLDFQPVRDFTFFVNIWFYNTFGYGGFHLLNLSIVGLILFLVSKILKKLNFDDFTVFLAIAIVAVHPVMNGAAAWVSNRKHLLSLFFILLYVNQCFKEEKSSWKSLIFCLLSFLSQPITVFIPGLVILYRRHFEKRSFNGWDLVIVIFSIAVFVINYFLYQNAQFSDRKFSDTLMFQPDLYLFNLGRVSSQILLPISMGLEYDPGNLLSMVGLFLTVIIVFLIFKYRRSWKEFFLIGIALSPLFTVLKWGPKDAYLLSTLLISAYLFCRIIKGKKHLYVILAFIPIFSFLSYNSRKFTPMWQNDLLLGKKSFETEGGFINTSFYAIQLAKADPQNCYDFFKEVFELYPNALSTHMLFMRANCLYNSQKSEEEKLSIFRKEQNPDLFATFYEAKLLEKMGDVEKSTNAYKSILNSMRDPLVKELFWDKICIREKHYYECKKLETLSKKLENQ